jgi:hypothetical protein
MPETAPTDTPNTPSPADNAQATALTPELVKQVTERVYALLLADLKIERERQRWQPATQPTSRGGGYAV